MKVRLEFIDSTWYGKVIEADENCIYKIDGQSAMNMLFEQEQGEHSGIIMLYKREDVPCIPMQADSHLRMYVFASDNFSWYYISKEYLLRVLGVINV